MLATCALIMISSLVESTTNAGRKPTVYVENCSLCRLYVLCNSYGGIYSKCHAKKQAKIFIIISMIEGLLDCHHVFLFPSIFHKFYHCGHFQPLISTINSYAAQSNHMYYMSNPERTHWTHPFAISWFDRCALARARRLLGSTRCAVSV